MAILSAKFEAGYGSWLCGYLPDGKEVAEYLTIYSKRDKTVLKSLQGKSRLEGEVREAYCFLLDEEFEKYRKRNPQSTFTLLAPWTEYNVDHPLLDALCCTDQDHILVASADPIGEEFFAEMQKKYGFRQADPDAPNINEVKVWNSTGKAVALPDPMHAFTTAAEAILNEYVGTLFDSGSFRHRLLLTCI